METWKAVEGFEGFYEVSDCAQLRSLDRKVMRGRTEGGFNVVKGRILKLPLVQGYPRAILCHSSGKKRGEYLHRIVAKAFVPNPDNLPVVNHKNGVKHDARPENLEWVSADDNKAHSWRVLGHGKRCGKNPRTSMIVKKEVPVVDYTNEQWKPVPNWEFYEASNCGRVRSLDHWRKCNKGSGYIQKGRILTGTPDNHCVCVSLTRGSLKCKRSIHQLVALAWIPNPESKAEVNHINGNSHDNRVGNLEWSTRLENQRHSRAVLSQCLGENSNLSKLTSEKVSEIRMMLANGDDVDSIAEKYGVTGTNIYHIWKRTTWKHVK